ncbi:UNVERIFIED_CONTAM: Lamin-like protein [Sesamum radiatum]|uniref:Lamin-like protein n=1 Tax=Sesamum radiatum TaxID=300843 RepID=A0AAW2MGB8_SESRA
MASRVFLIVGIILAVSADQALATDYVVGDVGGWELGVNYTAWASGKNFLVGDTIAFNYTPGVHNVVKVNGSEFQQCVASNASNALTSGNDVITLATPGRKWYICGVADHCSRGMKLVINVFFMPGAHPPVRTWAPAPTPAPEPGC